VFFLVFLLYSLSFLTSEAAREASKGCSGTEKKGVEARVLSARGSISIAEGSEGNSLP